MQSDDDRARDAQHTLWLSAVIADYEFGFGDLGQDANTALVKRLASIGEIDPSGGAIQKPHSEPFLNLSIRRQTAERVSPRFFAAAEKLRCSTTVANTRMSSCMKRPIVKSRSTVCVSPEALSISPTVNSLP